MSDPWCLLDRTGGLVWLVLVVGALNLAEGHSSRSVRDSSSESAKYWIFLADRLNAPESSSATRWTEPVDATYLDRLREIGVEVKARSRWLHAVSAVLSSRARSRVARLSFVQELRSVVTLYPLTATAAPSTSSSQRARPPGRNSPSESSLSFGPSRGPLSRINAIAPINRGLDGHGVRVGFLDANFNGLRHPAFSELRGDERLAALRTFTEHRQWGNHGAGVASVATGYAPGSLIGPAHGATVLGATTEYTQYERNVEEDNFVAGLEWLHRRGADVVNVSIGYARFDEGQQSYTPADLDGDTAPTTRAVDRAAQLGMTVVVSAGNSGCASPDSCWFYVNTPADADSAITVGAVLPDSSLASFSARGPTADGRRKPDVVVQGERVTAAWDKNRYARVGGTSFASPQVTGIVAQMLQVNPNLDPIEIRQLLRTTASQTHDPDTTKGWGIVNAEAAIRHAEWRARKNPPASLRVDSPYRGTNDANLIFWAAAPTRTSSLWVSLYSPIGRRVRHWTMPAHPGPNRIALDVEGIPPGTYRYQIRTNRGHRSTDRVTILEK